MAAKDEAFVTVRLTPDDHRRLIAQAERDDRLKGPMARVLVREALDAREAQQRDELRVGQDVA